MTEDVEARLGSREGDIHSVWTLYATTDDVKSR
jgi:hypothetical protein